MHLRTWDCCEYPRSSRFIIDASVQVSQALNRTEVASALTRFRAASPDAVVGCTYYDVCAEFLKQANATRFYMPAVSTPEYS